MPFQLPSISTLLASSPAPASPTQSTPPSSASSVPVPPIPFPSVLPFPDHAQGQQSPAQQPRRKYVCQYPSCNKSFTTSGHLARHNRIHTGERNYACLLPGCPSRFSRQDNMMQHYRTHLANSSVSHAALIANANVKARRKADHARTMPSALPKADQPPLQAPSNKHKWTPPLSPPHLEGHLPSDQMGKHPRYHPYEGHSPYPLPDHSRYHGSVASQPCTCCPPAQHAATSPYHQHREYGYGPTRPHLPPPAPIADHSYPYAPYPPMYSAYPHYPPSSSYASHGFSSITPSTEPSSVKEDADTVQPQQFFEPRT